MLLEEEVGNLQTEIEALTQWKLYLGKQLEWSATPSAITTQCLAMREHRERIDLVQDAVEHALHRYVASVAASRSLSWRWLASAVRCVCRRVLHSSCVRCEILV